MSYRDQQAWRDIQAFLPEEYRIPSGEEPAEEWWNHLGHRIHLDTYRNPEAPVRVILLHGVGTNGRQMSTILGRPLAQRGFETIAIDMPTYGVTQTCGRGVVRYDDWVRIGSDLITRERRKDKRPIVLYGLSAGGMETYHVAALNRKVAGIVGMTFLDMQDPQTRLETAHDWASGTFGSSLMRGLGATAARRIKVPMKLVSKMSALVNDPQALKVCLADKTSAGNSVSVAFLDSYLNYVPATQPEDFDICPILLTQPAADRWTPPHLAESFLNRISKVPVEKAMLANAGHYPLEQPGLDQMVATIAGFCERVGSANAA
jgi:alpha-beta hydrolase superfamily lysophospholipase